MPFVRTRQVAFHDTDASGVAHFSRLLCLVEEVEHEYLCSRGVEVLSPDCGWPRVHVEADYSSSAGLGDWLSIELRWEPVLWNGNLLYFISSVR